MISTGSSYCSQAWETKTRDYQEVGACRWQPEELRVRPEEWMLLCWHLRLGTLAGPQSQVQTSIEGALSDSTVIFECDNKIVQVWKTVKWHQLLLQEVAVINGLQNQGCSIATRDRANTEQQSPSSFLWFQSLVCLLLVEPPHKAAASKGETWPASSASSPSRVWTVQWEHCKHPPTSSLAGVSPELWLVNSLVVPTFLVKTQAQWL